MKSSILKLWLAPVAGLPTCNSMLTSTSQDLEAECVKPEPSHILEEMGLQLLKFISSRRDLTYGLSLLLCVLPPDQDTVCTTGIRLCARSMTTRPEASLIPTAPTKNPTIFETSTSSPNSGCCTSWLCGRFTIPIISGNTSRKWSGKTNSWIGYG